MERRTALALATAAAGTVLAASAGFAVNVGLLQHDNTKPVGVLDTSAIDATFGADPVDPTVVTVYVDDPPVQSGAPGEVSSDASSLAPTQSTHRDDDDSEAESESESDDSAPTGSVQEHDDDD